MFAQSQLASSEQVVYEGHTLIDEGAWCWFADPRALHYENASGTINSSYVGCIDVHGAIKAVQYDFLKKQRTEVLIRSYFQPDDHDNPTFIVLPDERVMVFYSRHTDEPCFYYRISRLPGDLTTLGEEKKIQTKDNTTYPSPFILSDDPEHIYLCWRGINWHPTIAKLSLPDADDNVRVEWGPYQIVQSTGARPYAKYYSNGKDRIYLAYTTGHPDNENPNWLYLNCVNIHTLQLEDVQGHLLSTIADGPFQVSREEQYVKSFPATVIDHTPDIRDWVWQITTDTLGNPFVAMVKISGNKKIHDYYYAYWDGMTWKEIFLTHGGGHFYQTPDIETCYSGGMALDPLHEGVVYCSVPVDGAFGRVYEIRKYTVNTQSRTVRAESVTHNSRKNNVRPYILPDSEDSPLRLVWMYGDYYDWIVSSSRSGYPTALHGDFQWSEETADLTDGLIVDVGGRSGNALNCGEVRRVEMSREGENTDFTLFLSIDLSNVRPEGKVCSGKHWAWEADSTTLRPVLSIDGKKYLSSNVLGTADSWLNHARGTTGEWYPIEPYRRFTLTVVSKGCRLTTYINGCADQSIEGDIGLSRLTLGRFNGWIQRYVLSRRALNSVEIARLVSQCR
ncbi:MAG: BNR repeat-containing protein [Paraprevotella sp.]|nr:BNR repeat-containing protein [Paraprevotella sp.]